MSDGPRGLFVVLAAVSGLAVQVATGRLSAFFAVVLGFLALMIAVDAICEAVKERK